MSSRVPAFVVLAAALLLGIVAGWVDLHNDEVQAGVLVIVVAAGLLGMWAPRLALLTGVIVGLGVPIAHLYARLTGYQLPYQMGHYAESFIALIPGVLAAGIGAAVRRVLTPGMHVR